MKIASYAKTESLDDALTRLEKLGEHGCPLAGATSFHFLSDRKARDVVDCTRLGLNSIRDKLSGFFVGATTTIAQCQAFQAPGWVLDQVARELATQQIRNVSTLGGNIVRIFPWSDFPVALLALNAFMHIERRNAPVCKMDADTFFSKQPFRHLAPGTLLTVVEVPRIIAPEGFGYHKEKLASQSFGRVTAACRLRLADERIANIRLTLGNALPFPKRLIELENALTGSASIDELDDDVLNNALAALKMRVHDGMGAEYLRHLSGVILRDVVQQALADAKG